MISVRGKGRYVVMDVAHNHYLRECELDAVLAQSQAHIAAGRVRGGHRRAAYGPSGGDAGCRQRGRGCQEARASQASCESPAQIRRLIHGAGGARDAAGNML